MFLDSVDYEEFAISVGRLAELSFVYRILLDSDSASSEENCEILRDVLFSFSDDLRQISDTLNLVHDHLFAGMMRRQPDQ